MRPYLVMLFERLIDHGMGLMGYAKLFSLEKFDTLGAFALFVIYVLPLMS